MVPGRSAHVPTMMNATRRKDTIMDDLLSIDEVCREFGFNRQRLAKMRWLGGESTPPFIKLSRTDIRYSRADVIAWLESRKLTSTAAAA